MRYDQHCSRGDRAVCVLFTRQLQSHVPPIDGIGWATLLGDVPRRMVREERLKHSPADSNPSRRIENAQPTTFFILASHPAADVSSQMLAAFVFLAHFAHRGRRPSAAATCAVTNLPAPRMVSCARFSRFRHKTLSIQH